MTQGSSPQLGWYQWAPKTHSRTGIHFEDRASQLTKTAKSLDLNLALSGAQLSLSALKRRSVAVFGLGAVGGEILTALARLGVGRLIGIDAGRYREDSWRTQPVFPEHGGHAKAWVQGLRARRHNPASEVWAAIGRAQDLPLSVLRKVDVFVTAGDNLELPVWAGNMAAALGKEALVQGAVHGPTWTAICRTYNLASADSPCPGCMLRSREWGLLSVRYGCDPAAATESNLVKDHDLGPTATLPAVCTTAAQMATAECLKRLLNIDAQEVQSEEISYCLLTHQLLRTTLPRNPSCRCAHEQWKIHDLTQPPSQTTLSKLASSINCEKDDLQIRGESHWVSDTLCSRCGLKSPVRKFVRGFGEKVGACSCGAALLASPIGSFSVMPPQDLEVCMKRPLSTLGLEPGGSLGLSSKGQNWTYFFFPGRPRFRIEESERKND